MKCKSINRAIRVVTHLHFLVWCGSGALGILGTLIVRWEYSLDETLCTYSFIQPSFILLIHCGLWKNFN